MIISRLFLNILFPPICFGCRKYNKNYLCENCWQKININRTLFFPDGPFQYTLAAATDYKSEALQNLIRDLKYDFLTSAMEPIKKIIDVYFKNLEIKQFSNFVIIPIPLSKKRYRKRGFNQAELIANYIADKFSLPIAKDILIKIKDSPKQSEAKDWQERLKNIDGCFSVTNPEKIKNKNIILVDDVYTSGATVNEAIRVLKLAGVEKVLVFTIAKAG